MPQETMPTNSLFILTSGPPESAMQIPSPAILYIIIEKLLSSFTSIDLQYLYSMYTGDFRGSFLIIYFDTLHSILIAQVKPADYRALVMLPVNPQKKKIFKLHEQKKCIRQSKMSTPNLPQPLTISSVFSGTISGDNGMGCTRSLNSIGFWTRIKPISLSI